MAPPSTNVGPRKQTNGVLPVTGSQTAGNHAKAAVKIVGPRLKVVIRRLAPGLTESEFSEVLGDEWKIGKGKVDWYQYKQGKVSKDPSKPSRPSRAYLHLINETHLTSLSETIKQKTFEDAQNTWNNSPSLLGPPTVEYAPYSRIPSTKRRMDSRQGQIDQDPEFMDFLESLISPVTVREIAEGATEETVGKGEKVTTTPLVQYLKEKKANKAKEAAAIKAGKHARTDSSSNKPASKEAPQEPAKKSAKDAKKDKLVEKASREAVRVLTKQAASSTPSSSVTTPDSPKSTPSQPRVRGSISAAARILQRDLGISAVSAHRKAKAEIVEAAAKSATETTAVETPTTSSSPAPVVIPTAPKAHGNVRGRGARSADRPASGPSKESQAQSTPIVLLKKSTPAAKVPATQATPTSPALPSAPAALLTSAPTGPASSTVPVRSTTSVAPVNPTKAAPSSTPSATDKSAPPRKVFSVAVPSANATRAFIKHANPSQGITEALLKESMETFGAVSHVEIDKRKGFAYVDFVDHEGLVKAMAANPTKIAQGTVQVLERKDAKPPVGPSSRGMFGGRGGQRGGAQRGGKGGTRGGATTATSTAPHSAPTGPANSTPT